MIVFKLLLTTLAATATIVQAQRVDGQYWPCNPAVNKTGSCVPNRGLPSSTYTIDFTKQIALPDGWTISNYATVKYGANGAEFTFKKAGDAPQLWTNWYMLGCKYEINLQIAPGTGMISSSVLMSDDFDEIDFEFSGNNFGFHPTNGKGQNNYFGKGIAGNYDRGQFFDVAQPTKQFHTYSVDWNSQRTIWGVDGQVLRTFKRSDADAGTHQYPQTPSKLQIGIWDGGAQGMNQGTVDWAGGYTNLSEAPFTMYVKSINIINYTPACAYNWTDQSGTWESIKAITDQNICNSIYGNPTSLKSGSTISTAIKITATTPAATSTSTVMAKNQITASTIVVSSSKAASVSMASHLTSYPANSVSKPSVGYTSLSVTTTSLAIPSSSKVTHTSTVTVVVSSPPSTVYKTTYIPRNSFSSSDPRSSTILTLRTTSTVYLSSISPTSSHLSFLVSGAPPTVAASQAALQTSTVLSSAPRFLVSGAPPTFAPSPSTALTSPKFLVSGAPPTFAPSSSGTAPSRQKPQTPDPSTAASLEFPIGSQFMLTGSAGIPGKGLKVTDSVTTSVPLVSSIVSKASSLLYGTNTAETSKHTSSSADGATHSSTGNSPKLLVSGAPPTFAPSSSTSGNGANFLVSGAPPTSAPSSASSGQFAKALFGNEYEPDTNAVKMSPTATSLGTGATSTVASGTGPSSGLTATGLESLIQYIVELLSAIVNRKPTTPSPAAPSAADTNGAYASIQSDVAEVLKKLTSRSERFKKHRKEPHAARRL